MTHSPSPWQRKPGTLTVRDANGLLVANVYSGHRGRMFSSARRGDKHCREQAEALTNAALLRAAPDMLAVLKELIDIEGPQPGTTSWASKVTAIIAQAESAS